MSQENVETVRRANAAFNRGDVDTALERLAPDAELRDLLNAPDQSTWVKGDEAIRETWTLWIDAFDELRADVNEYIDAAAAAGLTEVRVVHGRGTGVQRGMVQSALERHPRVVEFWDDDASHLGATVARLAAEP